MTIEAWTGGPLRLRKHQATKDAGYIYGMNVLWFINKPLSLRDWTKKVTGNGTS